MKHLLSFVFCLSAFVPIARSAGDIRIGLIGLDTSHVIAFTRLLNDENHAAHVEGGRVVAAFKGGSPDIEASATRVDRFTRQLRSDFGIKIVDSIPALCERVDAVMLESVDGRPHLEQARPVMKAKKPIFIDKPLAGSLRDAIEIFRLAKAHGVPCFSSSSYRFYRSLQALKEKDIGPIQAVISYGPCHLEPHHPDLFWYGIHPTEALFAVMGRGCQSVTRVSSADSDIVAGTWSEGRTGLLYGLRTGKTPHKVIAFGATGTAEQQNGGSYASLVKEIIRFFRTGAAPVSMEETIEIYGFMEAADESKRNGGIPIRIEDLIRKNGGGGLWRPLETRGRPRN